MEQLQAPGSGEIRIDREGCWYYNGAQIVHQAILDLFNASIEHDGSGGYRLRIGQETNPIVVEDTPYVVTHIEPELSGAGVSGFTIRLSDGTREMLCLESLFISPDNIPYCRVKSGSFPARFLRSPYYDLAGHIQQDAEGFYLRLSGIKHSIQYRDR